MKKKRKKENHINIKRKNNKKTEKNEKSPILKQSQKMKGKKNTIKTKSKERKITKE